MKITTELQDKAWAVLPKKFREEVMDEYDEHLCNQGEYGIIVCELESIFGEHNLSFDVEPEEMLCVKRADVMEKYALNEDILKHDQSHKGAMLLKAVFDDLFGSKCRPDAPSSSGCKAEPQPKEGTGGLNLRGMLEGHEGDTFYSPAWGENIVITPHPEDGFRITPKDLHGRTKGYLDIGLDGKADKDGCVLLFPSRALYEKHPLDAKRAWAEWQEGQNRKTFIKILPKYDGKKSWAEIVVSSRFTTLELAVQAAEAVRKTLEEFHKGRKP